MSAQKLAEIARARALKLKRRRQAAARAKAQGRRGKRRAGFWVALIGAAAIGVSGCAATKPEPATVTVMMPCGVETPQRPIMPTENLPADASLDDFVKSAIAEIERREGYEQLLLQSLIFCKSGEVWK